MVTSSLPDISIVIPSKDGAENLALLVPRLLYAWNGSASAIEIIIVDDGSRPPIDPAHAAWSGNCSVRVLRLDENRGQQYATMAGIGAARHQWVATMDDDGHPPEVLIRMVRRAQAGADLVYGVPVAPRANYARYAGTCANNALFRLFLGKPPGVRVTSFRLFRRSLGRRAIGTRTPFPYLSALLLAQRPVVASVVYVAGPAQKSRYTPVARVRLFGRLLLYWGPLASIGRLVRRPRRFDEEQ